MTTIKQSIYHNIRIYIRNSKYAVIKLNQNPCLAGSQHLIQTSRISTAFYPAPEHQSPAAVYPFLLSDVCIRLW